MQITAVETGLSALYQEAINAAVNFWDQQIKNPISITIDFATETTGLASTTNLWGYNKSYSTVETALTNSATSADDLASVHALPSVDPFGGASYFVSVAEAEALGLLSSYSGAAATISLNTTLPLTYDPNHRAVSGDYDAIGALEHEISEVLGRIAGSDGALFLTPEALHRYSSPGVIDTSNSAANAYFSVDGQHMLNLIGETSGDIADWAAGTVGDSFGIGYQGLAANVSAVDLREMDILGYNLVSSTVPAPAVHANDLTYSSTASGYNHFIDTLNFEASYPDLVNAFGTNQAAMQNWYNTFEPNEHRTETFDGLDYIASYNDLINAFGSAGSMQAVQDAGASHYISNGLNEGRSTTFNGLDYIASYGDLIKAFGANNDAGAYHYIEHGSQEGRTTTFDGLDYIASYVDLILAFGANEQAGAAHFINNGLSEGRTTTFDGLSYIAQYTDLMTAFGVNNDEGASHYINNGHNEGRSTAFNVAAYEQAHPDLIGQYSSNDAFLTAYIKYYDLNGHFLT